MIFFSACELWTTAFAFPASFVVGCLATTKRVPVYLGAVTLGLGTLAAVSDGAAETAIDHRGALVLATMATEIPQLQPMFRRANADRRLTLDEWRAMRAEEQRIRTRDMEIRSRKALAAAEARFKALDAPKDAPAR